MESAITISSSDSSCNNSTSIESFDPDAPLVHLPANGDPKKSYKSSCTPTTLEKVDNWLKTLDVSTRERCHSSCSQSLDFHSSESHFLHEIIPFDLNDPKARNDEIIQDQLHDDSNESFEDSIASSYKLAENALPRGRREKCGQVTAVKERKNTQQMRECDQLESTPENVKKQELCSYLQLMKPTDKKTVSILQNRRSVRVKNLSLMQKNRDLEKKLNEHSEDRNKNRSASNFSEGRSFRGVGNDKNGKIVGPKDQPETFRFPNPPDCVKHAISYFDEIEQEDWFKEWREHPSNHTTAEVNQQENQNCFTGKSSNFLDGKFYILEARNLVNSDLLLRPRSTSENRHYRNVQLVNTNNGANNESTKHPIQILDSVYSSFSIPTPPTKSVETIRDFDVTVEENRDIFTLNSSAKPISCSNRITCPRKRNFGSATRETFRRKRNESPTKSPSFPMPPQPFRLVETIRDFDVTVEENRDIFTLIPRAKPTSCSNHINNNTESSVLPKAVNDWRIKRPGEKHFGSARSESFRRKRKESTKSTSKSEIVITTAKSRKNDRGYNGLTPEMKSRWKNLRNFIPVKSSENAQIELISRKKLARSISRCSAKMSSRKSVISSRKKKNRKSTESKADYSTEYSYNEQSDSTSCSEFQRKIPSTPELTSGLRTCPSSSSEKFSSEQWKSDDPCVMQYQDCEPPSRIMAVYTYKAEDRLETQSCNNVGKKSPYISQIFVNDILNQASLTEGDNITHNSSLNGKTVSEKAAAELQNSPKSIIQPQSPSVANRNPATFISFNSDRSPNSFYRCLNSKRQRRTAALESEPSSTNWANSTCTQQKKKENQHLIQVSKTNGRVINVFYRDYNLIVCQESLVSFWTQTALGNVLGAQNMWITKGSIQRLSTNKHCIFKEALEMVVSTESSVAYIELWTKEHQSAFREGPVADVFAIVYYWKNGQTGLDKKVLQLENIKGFADDVRYSILTSSPKIIVSWHLASNEVDRQKTFVHCYQLTADFQSVCHICKFEPVEHYVSSLHNIQGCDSLIMGSGENKITLWNIERGYVAATIEMADIKSTLCTLWAKCDRGFLFTLQECVDKELRIVAIHGMNHSWKKLASYVPSNNYKRLRGVYIENGIVLACYQEGIICWNAQTADKMFELFQNEPEFISGKYIISIVNDQLKINHAVTYILNSEES